MYTSFYGLKTKPFQISSDPEFIWFGEKHKEAFATLRYGILNNKGFLLLTGDVGTGKTTLINALIQSLSNDVICVSVTDPNLPALEFINYVAYSFGIKKVFKTKLHFLIEFQKFLVKAYESGKKVLLIIDEAQLLTEELLEQIRLLSNIDRADTKLLNIFFVGQNEFNDIILKEKNRAVRQRLTLNYNIDPFTPDETGEYIRHRLKVAGSDKKIFTQRAVQRIHMHSGGFPRRINIICDHCLLSGYVNEKIAIDEKIVDECAAELEIPFENKKRDIRTFHDPLPVEGPYVRNRDSNNGRRKIMAASIVFFLVIALSAMLLTSPTWFRSGFLKANEYYAGIQEGISDFFRHTETPILPHPKQKEKKKDRHSTVGAVKADSKKTGAENMEGSADQKLSAGPPAGQTPKKSQTELFTKDSPLPSQIIEENLPRDSNTPKPLAYTSSEQFEPLKTEKLVLRFRHDTNQFSPAGEKKLKNFAEELRTHPRVDIYIIGHTDATGNSAYNEKLSLFRANIVKSYLMGKGIRGDRIHTRGMGSRDPVATNSDEQGRTMNRRVEIDVYQNDQ